MNKNEFIVNMACMVNYCADNEGYKLVSPIIAMACLESGYGTSKLASNYYNYFGMKCGSSWTGKSVNMKTWEEYTPGEVTNIKANFRAYDSELEGVKGFFKFISTKRYANLKTANTPEEFLTMIKADGYCTDSKYVDKCMSIINQYNLTVYDNYCVNNVNSDPIKYVDTDSIKYIDSDSIKYVDTDSIKYYCKLETSKSMNLDDMLKAINVPDKYIGNYKKRTPIANANGITNYKGSYEQNIKLMNLIKKGELLKP